MYTVIVMVILRRMTALDKKLRRTGQASSRRHSYGSPASGDAPVALVGLEYAKHMFGNSKRI